MCPTLHPPLRRRLPVGFTLVEMVVVMAVVAIVACLAAPSLREFLDARRMQGAAAALATDLRFIRSEAVARNQAVRFSLRPLSGGTCYVVHTGAAGLCDCNGGDGPARCTGGAQPIRTVRLPASDRVGVQANVSSMLFDPVHGTTTPAGTLRVTGATPERVVQHVVNLMGRVRSCSPNGAVPGYAPC